MEDIKRDEQGKSMTEHEREIVRRALANKPLMEQVEESLAALQRGEKPIPGRQVVDEARARRGKLHI